MESILKISPKYRLGKSTNKYHILDILSYSFFKQKGFSYIFQTSTTFRQLLKENFNAALLIFEDALSHIDSLPQTHSYIKLPVTNNEVSFVLMAAGRLYTEYDSYLHVY